MSLEPTDAGIEVELEPARLTPHGLGPLASSRRSAFWAGVRATLPLVVGAIPFGFLFGALAVSSGLSPAAASAMSAFVYAGAAQFIAAGLVAGGAGLAVIVLTTLVVNLRHMLYAASLAPHMRGLPQWLLALLAFPLTDETYVVAISRYQQTGDSPYKHWFYGGSAAIMYVNWQLCTWIGIRVGQVVPNPERWGLGFAFVVTFIGILAPTVRNRPMVICVATAGVAALLLHGLPHQLGLVVAALLGVASGLVSERAAARPSEAFEQSR